MTSLWETYENGNVGEKQRIHLIMCKYIQYYNTVHVTKPIIENSESIKIIMDKMLKFS
jgi:hypothetical protein